MDFNQKKQINMADGFIDVVTSKLIKGWALANKSSDPVTVELYINGSFFARKKADGYRPGLLNKGIHKTGNCEYSFELENELSAGDIVSVKIKEPNFVLKKSPWVFNKSDNSNILIIGLPKSGTSILTYKIAGAFENAEVVFEPKGRDKENELKFHGNKLAQGKSIVTKCLFPWHTDFSNLVEISKLYSKVVFIIRDPRDNMISSFFYVWNKLHKPDPNKFEKALELTIKKEVNPANVNFFDMDKLSTNPKQTISRKYNSVINCIKKLDQKWHVIKYEDFIDENYEELEKYLNIKIAKTAEVPKQLSRVVRSKKYGNWRDWYTPEDIDIYQPVLNPILDYFGYDTLDWKVNLPAKLDSSKSSDYMKKMFYGE